MFLGWYDPDKKKPAQQKLAEAIDRYVEKFGRAPAACLTNPTDAAELSAATPPPGLAVHAVTYLPRWTFYVGVAEVADGPDAAVAA